MGQQSRPSASHQTDADRTFQTNEEIALSVGHKIEEEITKEHRTIQYPRHPTALVVDPTESDRYEENIDGETLAKKKCKYFEEVLMKHPEWGPFHEI